MSIKTAAKSFDCVEMKRRIQEKIYDETRDLKPDEFLAYIHRQVQESRFATFFAVSDTMSPVSGRSMFQPIVASIRIGEAEAEYRATSDEKARG
jgi:hypothetical protein